jgi:hypothetical protein
MDVIVILHSGRKIEMSDVTATMTWIDVAVILLDNGIIDENELIEIEDDTRFSGRFQVLKQHLISAKADL